MMSKCGSSGGFWGRGQGGYLTLSADLTVAMAQDLKFVQNCWKYC